MTTMQWTRDAATSHRPMTPPIRAVLEFIEANFAEPLALSDLASMCGLSLHRFVTVFRQQVGLPPHRYLCVIRVQHAQRLLQSGVPAASAAIDSGFFDQSHLARHFKRQFGVTPGRFAGLRHSPSRLQEVPSCA